MWGRPLETIRYLLSPGSRTSARWCDLSGLRGSLNLKVLPGISMHKWGAECLRGQWWIQASESAKLHPTMSEDYTFGEACWNHRWSFPLLRYGLIVSVQNCSVKKWEATCIATWTPLDLVTLRVLLTAIESLRNQFTGSQYDRSPLFSTRCEEFQFKVSQHYSDTAVRQILHNWKLCIESDISALISLSVWRFTLPMFTQVEV